MPTAAVDIDVLRAAVDQKRKEEGFSWRELAHRLAISPSTFTRMAQGRRPDVDTFTTLVSWLGMNVQDFVKGKRLPKDSGKEPLAMISTYLRSAREISREEAEALEEIMRVAYRRLRERK